MARDAAGVRRSARSGPDRPLLRQRTNRSRSVSPSTLGYPPGSRRSEAEPAWLCTGALHADTRTARPARVAAHHARLIAHVRRSGTPRGAHDLIIAAHAAETGRTVLSRNAPGLATSPASPPSNPDRERLRDSHRHA